MAKIFIEEDSLTAIGNAIRAKTGGTEALTVPNGMVNAINSISSGGGGSGGENKLAAITEDTLTEITESDLLGITKVIDYAFYQRKSLKRVYLPEGIVTIGQSVFLYCKNLEELKIPSTVTSMGATCVYNTPNLKSLTFYGTTPPTFAASTFEARDRYHADLVIYVPSNAISAYTASGYFLPSIWNVQPIE